MPVKRHRVNVMRPTKALDERGQLQGTDEVIIADWPCSIDTLRGSKPGNERMVVPSATHSVKGYGDPKKPIKHKDYLTGGSIGSKVLTIEHKEDKDLNEVNLTLICEETTLG